MRALGRLIGIAIAWLLLAVATTAIWLHYHRAQGSTAIHVAALAPFAVIIAAASAALFAVFRRWMALCLAVAAVIALGVTQGPLWVTRTVSAGERFAVLSANLRLGSADITALAARADSADASLVVLQEVTDTAVERIRTSSLVRRLPYQYEISAPGSAGTMLLSRAPLTEQARTPRTLLHNLEARTDFPGASATRVLGVHIAAPLDGYAAAWNRELAALKAQLRTLPAGPVIVAGDFNATWDHPQYRELIDDGFVDAAAQSGAGFVPTYPTDRWGGMPLVALDHVIVRGFTATNFYSFDLEGSDHRGVVVSLVES